MNNLVWEVFKKTGNIEAYLYLRDCEKLFDDTTEYERENDIGNDNFEHPGDCT